VGATLLLVSVPLSYTFAGVSIPFVQLLMRGDIIIIAPVVDVLCGRKVRWYSWLAFALVLVGIAVNVTAREGFNIPPLLVLIIVLYTIGYFIRLLVMTRVAKNADPAATQRYFVEERVISIPLSILLLAVIAIAVPGQQGQQVYAGFTSAWSSDAIWLLLIQSLTLFVISVVSALILLDKHENTYCVPLERSASIIAGVIASYVLAIFFGLPYPTKAELFGAALLAIAVVVLSLGPRLGQSRPVSKDMRTAPR
jgi:drug/metabolite transporter (DMT)-like permease